MSTVEVTKQPNKYVTVTQKKNVSTVVAPSDQVLEVHDAGVAGPQGPQGIQGPPGPQGPQGESSGPVSYTHNQHTPSNTWSITHNLGYAPNVTVVDSAGTIIEGDLQYVDGSAVTISFSASFAGSAYLS